MFFTKDLMCIQSKTDPSERPNTFQSRREGGGRVLNKVLYREALPRGPTLYPFVYHFDRKGALSYTFNRKMEGLSHTFLTGTYYE